jgi:hypothetical protein
VCSGILRHEATSRELLQGKCTFNVCTTERSWAASYRHTETGMHSEERWSSNIPCRPKYAHLRRHRWYYDMITQARRQLMGMELFVCRLSSKARSRLDKQLSLAVVVHLQQDLATSGAHTNDAWL